MCQTKQNNTTTDYDQDRKEKTGKPRHTKRSFEAAAAVCDIYMSSIRRFYLRSRSGTLLPCRPSPSSFRQPRFPHELYIPPPPLQRICGAHYSVSLHRIKHERQRMKQRLPTASTGFARCRQASGLQCTETKLLLMVLLSGAGVAVVCVGTRTHTQPSSVKRGIRTGTQQATTPAVTFYPRTETAQAPTN